MTLEPAAVVFGNAIQFTSNPIRIPSMTKLHLKTLLVLFPLAGILFWLNYLPKTIFGEVELPPPQLGLVGRFLFFRGWPLCPGHVCLIHGLEYHPEEDFLCWGVLMLDALLAFLILAFAAVMVEWATKNVTRSIQRCKARPQ